MPKVRVSGAWKNPKNVYVKATVSGTSSWRTVTEGWIKVSGTWRKAYGLPPSAPTITGVTVANGQAYASTATVSVAFTAGSAGGSAITEYTVTSSSGNTNTGASSPITIADNIGVSRTYTVSATNAYGTSESSAASTSITPATIPQVPTIGTPSITNTTTVSLPFTGSNGGSSLTSLGLTSSPSIALSFTGTNSPVSVSGSFATNQAYTFIMNVGNPKGTSANSSSSSSITPNPYVAPPPPTPVIPSFTSNPTVTGITTTGGTLSWSSVNQASYIISAPGTALNGSGGYSATSRLFTGLSAGTTYTYQVTITSSTGHTATAPAPAGSFTAGTAPTCTASSSSSTTYGAWSSYGTCSGGTQSRTRQETTTTTTTYTNCTTSTTSTTITATESQSCSTPPPSCTLGAPCGSGYTCYPEGFYTYYSYNAACECVLENGFC